MTKIADLYLLGIEDTQDPWQIIEEGWSRERNKVSESVFSLGNEYMGVRGYAEEGVSEQSLRGSYFNGIYEEIDLEKSYKGIVTKTHFMVNSVDWLYTEIYAGDEKLDMAVSKIENFRRVLDMRDGTLTRSFDWHTQSGAIIKLEFIRFLCFERENFPALIGTGYQKILFTVLNDSRTDDLNINVIIANSFNTGHGWDNKNYWNLVKQDWFDNETGLQGAAVQAVTKRTCQQVFSGFTFKTCEGAKCSRYEGEKTAGFKINIPVKKDGKAFVEKRVYNFAEKKRNAVDLPVWEKGMAALKNGLPEFDAALEYQREYWANFWKYSDIRIKGDLLNQQGIRYCIFQMHQTYHGFDPSNNIGAKGLTGEAYNGHAFWDTETYCLPFYLFSNLQAAKNLLEYRYVTLDAAKERAKMLDCTGACYPIATLNGEEACNLWQHASLQFQPSTAVAYGIAHYHKLSGDDDFLYGNGAEMLVEVCKFLASRGSWNNAGTGFGFYAVMGPDEFHMMVNHNCYTNYMAKKTFEYTENILKEMEKKIPQRYTELCRKTGLDKAQRDNFAECAEKIIILYDEKTKLYEQHEGYYNLPKIEISKIPVTDFPLYHNWSYDRIYRTSMIKQPDVLMFMFLYNGDFSKEVKEANYEFYEPNTIHESSLSPSIHSIFACELGKHEEAFRFFGFATRMDLDNYNRNTHEGLHTTSIAAAWVNIVYGFAGLRSDSEILSLNPSLPKQWTEYEFGIFYKSAHIRIRVTPKEVKLSTNNTLVMEIPLLIYGRQYNFNSTGLTVSRE